MNRAPIQSQFQETALKSAVRTAQTIEPVQLGTSATDLFVTTTSDFWIIHLIACNTTGGSVSLDIYAVPSGGTADETNLIYEATLAANTSEVLDVVINHRIPAGAKLQASASVGTSINIAGWGYEQGSEE